MAHCNAPGFSRRLLTSSPVLTILSRLAGLSPLSIPTSHLLDLWPRILLTTTTKPPPSFFATHDIRVASHPIIASSAAVGSRASGYPSACRISSAHPLFSIFFPSIFSIVLDGRRLLRLNGLDNSHRIHRTLSFPQSPTPLGRLSVRERRAALDRTSTDGVAVLHPLPPFGIEQLHEHAAAPDGVGIATVPAGIATVLLHEPILGAKCEPLPDLGLPPVHRPAPATKRQCHAHLLGASFSSPFFWVSILTVLSRRRTRASMSTRWRSMGSPSCADRPTAGSMPRRSSRWLVSTRDGAPRCSKRKSRRASTKRSREATANTREHGSPLTAVSRSAASTASRSS